MRKIILSPHDMEMFAADMTASELEFIEKHWKTFRQMWTEQGRKFWIQFLATYRRSASEYGVINEMRKLIKNCEPLIDELFIFLHEEFIEGRSSMAKKLIEDIIILAMNKDKMQYLNSKSLAKDPFYYSETRDSFRHLFGSPKEKASYFKVYALHEIYTKFACAVVTCLRRWLTADELPPGSESNWQPTVLTEPHEEQSSPPPKSRCLYCNEEQHASVSIFKRNLEDTYQLEMRRGRRCGPSFMAGWKQHEDPRFHDPQNPLYDLTEDPETDWRENLNKTSFSKFYQYVTEKELLSHCTENPEMKEYFMETLLAKRLKWPSGDQLMNHIIANSSGMGFDFFEDVFPSDDSSVEDGSRCEAGHKSDDEYIQIRDTQYLACSKDSLTLQSFVDMKTVRAKSDMNMSRLEPLNLFPAESRSRTQPTKAEQPNKKDHSELGKTLLESISARTDEGDLFSQMEIDRVIPANKEWSEDEDGEKKLREDHASKSATVKWTRKMCSHCKKYELLPKTFRKCQRCKELQLKSARYYCSRECQAEDWKARHKCEHKHNILK